MMKNLWNDNAAITFFNDPLQLRVYTSQLLGQEPELVLHGGGNTSVKITVKDYFGDPEEILFVKGSGWDLSKIQTRGFAPVKLDVLKRMVTLDRMSDTDMVRIQRSAMTDPEAPNPSIEAILHAIIPFKYVDHTHADAVVTLTNTQKGEALIREIYKDRVLIVPYIKPGFKLGKKIFEMTRNANWKRFEGMILMHHGILTFADDARTSYQRMIKLVSLAEKYLRKQGALGKVAKARSKEDLLVLSRIRHHVSLAKGKAMLARLDKSPEACGFAGLSNVKSIATRGPMTSDHLIRIKPVPVIVGKHVEKEITDYSSAYKAYFEKNTDGCLTCLDPAPRWAVWPKYGTIAFGRTITETTIVSDIVRHTIRSIQWGEAIGKWKALSKKQIFEMEYWELQQAKVHKGDIFPELQGKVA
ncbi:MAG: class II aldolase/adducin family protein, partial [Ignavibacteriaceae bacterium]|nr:class II aldolase/adducin family protein [Ignavibacteriaceae bacterium]